jgi:hypothetical protein
MDDIYLKLVLHKKIIINSKNLDENIDTYCFIEHSCEQIVLHGWNLPFSSVITEWINASFPGIYLREVCFMYAVLVD